MPTYLDWQNPDIHDYLEHYLGASAKYTTEERMRMLQLTHNMVASADSAHMEVTTVHAEGSMEAQRMMILVESPLKQYRDMALTGRWRAAEGLGRSRGPTKRTGTGHGC